jgi:hypothetical protein
MIGQTFRRYQILAKLGAGGMGEVFRPADTNSVASSPSKFCLQPWPAIPNASHFTGYRDTTLRLEGTQRHR